MNTFKVIPVVDILNSEAVHAIKGKRTEYRPLKSNLFNTTNPYNIIQVLKEIYFFNEFYLADLDSILRRKPNIDLLSQILETLDVKIMLDPGIIDDKDITLFSNLKFNNLIFGLETIKNFQVIENALQVFDSNSIILSIDMYKGKILSRMKDLSKQHPLEIMKRVENLGIKNYILLDLYRVGQKIGKVPQLYLDIRQKFDGNFIVGGGIKDLGEIISYKNYNFSGVLIATALYDGTIKMEELKRLNIL
ncbi:MAG: HisA/HisF-related TIM barrel protein [Promethearchaeota archaeon]